MAEPKPLASLSSALLARKGGARPAMRRQTTLHAASLSSHDDLGWNDMGYDVDPTDHGAEISRLAGNGLSPMAGHAPAAAPLTRDVVQRMDAAADLPEQIEAPVVHEQHRRIASELTVEAPVVTAPAPALAPAPAVAVAKPKAAPRPRADAGAKGNFAFTLRLDPVRHLKLRLSSAINNRSAQQILVQLLDDYLAAQPDLAAIAASANPR